MQVELPDRHRWRTRIELANAIFEYFEIFHNRQRRHSALGMRTPIKYERIHYDNLTVALQNQASRLHETRGTSNSPGNRGKSKNRRHQQQARRAQTSNAYGFTNVAARAPSEPPACQHHHEPRTKGPPHLNAQNRCFDTLDEPRASRKLVALFTLHSLREIEWLNRPGFCDCCGYWLTASRAVGF